MAHINAVGREINSLTLIEKITKKGSDNHIRTHYLCKCDCGKDKIISWSSLRTGRAKSCGCKNSGILLSRIQKPEGEAAFNQLFATYKCSAKSRGLEFNLDKERFKEITKQNCEYCGIPPFRSIINRFANMNGTYIYNGIDRVDSSKGYIEGNIVPCCRNCNVMKMNLSLEEFTEHIERIYSHLQTKK